MPEADTQPLMKKGTEANRRTELKQKMIDYIIIVYLRFGNHLRVKHVKHGKRLCVKINYCTGGYDTVATEKKMRRENYFTS